MAKPIPKPSMSAVRSEIVCSKAALASEYAGNAERTFPKHWMLFVARRKSRARLMVSTSQRK